MCTRDNLTTIAPPVAPTDRRDLTVPPTSADLSDRVLGGQYQLLRRIVDELGATTYEAEHSETGRRLILKVLAPQAGAEQDFFAGARAAVILRRDHLIDILGVTDAGRDPQADGAPLTYLAIELRTGESLATTLEMDGPLRWTRVLSIARQICRTLVEARDRGIEHGEIRLDTCFRCSGPDTADLIELLDFHALAPGAHASDGPEQLQHRHRAQLHALGLLMYQLLTGHTPHTGLGGGGPADSRDPQSPVAMRRTLPSLEISPDFEAIVMRALAQDPQERFTDARTMLAALAGAEPATARASNLPRNPLSWGTQVGKTRARSGPMNSHRGAGHGPGEGTQHLSPRTLCPDSPR